MKSAIPGKPPSAALERWAFAGALLLSAFYLITSIYISLHRLFWFDEICTTLTIRLRDWHTIWTALLEPAEQTPIGYLAIARTFDQLFGPAEIGIRLPSTLAVIGGMWLTYDATRRITDRLHGLLAMAALTCSFLPYYAYEGRSYGLYFFFAAAALWAWIRRSPFLLAAAFFCGVLIHYYIVLCLLPFYAEEAYHWKPWRRPSLQLVSATLGAVAGLTPLLPQMAAARHVWSGDFWAPPVGRMVPSLYTNFFPAGLFLLSMAILWIVINHDTEAVTVRPVSSAERVGWFALLIPIAGYVLAKVVTHAYVDRYMIGLLPGVALAFSCLVWRRFPDMPRVSVGIVVLLVAYGMVAQEVPLRHPERIEVYGPTQQRTRSILAMEEQLWSSGVHYIVMDVHDHLFLTARYYSTHPERYVWWTRLDRQPQVFDLYPLQYWSLDDVKQHAHEAVFVDLEPEKLEALQQAGIRTSVHGAPWLSLTRVDLTAAKPRPAQAN